MLTALITGLINDLRKWRVVLQNSFRDKQTHYNGISSKLVTVVCCAGQGGRLKGLEPLASGAGWPQETLQVSSGSEDHLGLGQVSKPAVVLLSDPCSATRLI